MFISGTGRRLRTSSSLWELWELWKFSSAWEQAWSSPTWDRYSVRRAVTLATPTNAHTVGDAESLPFIAAGVPNGPPLPQGVILRLAMAFAHQHVSRPRREQRAGGRSARIAGRPQKLSLRIAPLSPLSRLQGDGLPLQVAQQLGEALPHPLTDSPLQATQAMGSPIWGPCGSTTPITKSPRPMAATSRPIRPISSIADRASDGRATWPRGAHLRNAWRVAESRRIRDVRHLLKRF